MEQTDQAEDSSDSMREVSNRGWLSALRWYSTTLLAGNLLWELAQLPLYTLWGTATPSEIAFAVAHCAAGDLLIGLAALVIALLVTGGPDWPQRGFVRVAVLALALGVLYTLYSEWLNVEVRRTWAYTPAMPRLPGLGTGLAPLAQWLVVPTLAWWHVARVRAHRGETVD